MKPTITIVMFVLAILLMTTAPMAEENSAADASSGDVDAREAASTDPTRDYVIGPGDVIEIAVWKNEDLKKVSPVAPDGKLHFPLIGEIIAGGKTVGQIKAEVEEKIRRSVPNPELYVGIKQINSMMIYVIGRAIRPGRLVLNSNLNVLQALTMAGGPNTFAKRDDIKIFRETDGGTRIFQFDYEDVSEGLHLEQNIMLERGDIIVVP